LAPGDTISIVMDRFLMVEDLATIGQDMLTDVIWHLVLDIEKHEAMEWFTINGQRLHEPHPTRP